MYSLFVMTILIYATCGSRCLRIKNTESYERVRITWLNHLSVLCFSADTLHCVIVHSSAGLNCDCVTPPTLVFYTSSFSFSSRLGDFGLWEMEQGRSYHAGGGQGALQAYPVAGIRGGHAQHAHRSFTRQLRHIGFDVER